MTLKLVDEFHKSFNLPNGRSPGVGAIGDAERQWLNEFSISLKLVAQEMNVKAAAYGSLHLLRMQLMTEELAEVCEALCDQNLENLLKELSDLQYTVDGTVISFGLDQVWERAFARVHESNMSKLDANGHPIISDSGRVVKGPNYSPAKLGDLL